MKIWFYFSTAIFSYIKNLKLSQATSTPEAAIVIYTPLANNTSKTSALKTAVAVVAFAAMSHGQMNAQNSATIDPKYYSIENPYVVPNLEDQATLNLTIKAWEMTPITIDGMDAWSSTMIWDPNWNDVELSDKIIINKPWTRTREYKENGERKTTNIVVNYQADIYDRTPGSSSKDTRPDAIRVDKDQQATLSAGPNINPTWWNYAGYKRKNINDANYTWSPIDSIRNVSRGTYIARTNDGVKRTNDTIVVSERPTANSTTKTLTFPSTIQWAIYKVYKFDPATTVGTDSAWVEDASFTGTWEAYTLHAEIGLWRVGIQRTASTDTEIDTKTLAVDFTDAIDIPDAETSTSFKQQNRTIYFSKVVSVSIYNSQGKVMVTSISDEVIIPPNSPSGVYIIRYAAQDNQKQEKSIIVN